MKFFQLVKLYNYSTAADECDVPNKLVNQTL